MTFDLTIDLPDAEATLDLGRILAGTLPSGPPYPALLLAGALGAGKTTLARGLVEGLPGGGTAEVSSPSFNIVNEYPTSPEVHHYDLYRLEGLGLDEAMQDDLADRGILAVVEWTEHLPGPLWPGDRLLLRWTGAESALGHSGPGRTVEAEARGGQASAWLRAVAEELAGRSR
jgi:tRNA threonylcarbamoyladenosine biosynthesis protein TsaE